MVMADNVSSTHEKEEEDIRGRIRTIVYVYCLATIIVIGIIFNVLNIIVLVQRSMKSNVYLYLRIMSFSDLLALIFDITYAANLYARRPKSTFGEAFFGAHLEFFLKQSCNSTSKLLTMLTAIERYIALCHPHKAPTICTRRRTVYQIVCAICVAILFNIPRIWERKIEPFVDPATNRTMYNDKVLSEFSKGDYYTFHKYLYTSLFMFLPLITLAVLNTRIIIALRQYSRVKEGMTTQSDEQKKEQRRTTMVLIMVVIAFLILITPGAIAYILQNDESFGVFVFVCISDLMGELNFAINFLIYITFNKTFRSVFIAVFTPKKRRGQEIIAVSVLPSRAEGNKALTSNPQVKRNQVQPQNNAGSSNDHGETGPSDLHM